MQFACPSLHIPLGTGLGGVKSGNRFTVVFDLEIERPALAVGRQAGAAGVGGTCGVQSRSARRTRSALEAQHASEEIAALATLANSPSTALRSASVVLPSELVGTQPIVPATNSND